MQLDGQATTYLLHCSTCGAQNHWSIEKIDSGKDIIDLECGQCNMLLPPVMVGNGEPEGFILDTCPPTTQFKKGLYVWVTEVLPISPTHILAIESESTANTPTSQTN